MVDELLRVFVRAFSGAGALLMIFFTLGSLPASAAELSPAIVPAFERFTRTDQAPDPKALLAGGRLLLSELSCTACHASQQKELEPKSGPRLESAGRRLHAAWIAAYLERPQAIKPGTTMPDMLAGVDANKRPRVIAALTAFLVSQQTAFPELKASGANPVPHEFWNKGNAANGQQLLHKIGCVACHEPSADYAGGTRTNNTLDELLETLEPEEIARMGLSHAMHKVPSVPLPNARDKYTRQGLAMFLLDPASVRPAGRMPAFKLRTSDAADIAAWFSSQEPSGLIKNSGSAVSAALREEGKRLFTELRCSECHSASGVKKIAPRQPIVRLKSTGQNGCLSSTALPGLPLYALDRLQRSALQAALVAEQTASKNAASKPAAESPAESTHLIMMQLNCYACHQRGAIGGIARGRDRFFETVGQVDLGDEGRLPPPLTGVGAKLTSGWLKTIFQGNGNVRPHLEIRMPVFPLVEVEPLIALLSATDAPNGAAKKTAPPDKSLAEAGRTIFNLGCVQCHPVRGEALPSVVGVDIGKVGRRIQRDWFDKFLLNPASLKPRTRMPTFFAPGSVNQEILGGDVDKQISALWSYLEDIDRQPLPEKIEQIRRQNFELVPRERPIVLRTFMQLAGTHAIAVGFPEQLHYALDAENVRLAELWSGRFLDAQGTWNDRFAPEAMPLSQARIPLPKGPDLAILTGKNPNWPEEVLNSTATPSPALPRFLGYRLDKAGVPEFRYRVGEFLVVDRMTPISSAANASDKPHAMRREMSIAIDKSDRPANGSGLPPGAQLWLRAAGSGKPLQRTGNSLTYASGLTVTLPPQLMSSALLRNVGTGAQCIVPLPATNDLKVVLEYRWK